jgi:hypothetical protein
MRARRRDAGHELAVKSGWHWYAVVPLSGCRCSMHFAGRILIEWT